jgi:hypothetical protein
MRRSFLAVIAACIILALAGCGGGGSSPPPIFEAKILSDPGFDGDIEFTPPTSFTVTEGMSLSLSPPVQSVFAGLVPGSTSEFRAFLDFPLRGQGGVPFNAVIDSAFLDIVITSIQPSTGTIPIRIELVSFQPPTLLASDFDRTIQPPLAFTTILPPISLADVGQSVAVDVTPLMVMAQRLGLTDFQVRVMEDLGFVSPGLIEINDTTGANRPLLAPLLHVTFF